MNRLSKLWWTARGVGWRNLPRRVMQSAVVRTGLLRRRLDPRRFADEAFRAATGLTVAAQPDLWAALRRRFLLLPSPQALADVCGDALWARRAAAVAEDALRGDYPMFGWTRAALGRPVRFNRDPFHDVDWPVGEHWLGTAVSGPPRHDIKLVWEPARLAAAWYLARQYARSGERRHAAGLWVLFDAFVEQNPPQETVAWACGQEMTFRLMALLFGAVVTLDSGEATPERLWALSRLAWQTATHIAANHNQARMQGNNHAISEAVGLWTIGLLFPDLPRAAAWRDLGRRTLAAETPRQIYDDGSYVQHSMNYHRLVLDDLMWAIRLGQVNGEPLPPVVLDRFRAAADWLLEMLDPAAGRVPNYGCNDGAHVLPLSCCDYVDFRPVVQAASYLAHSRRRLGPGPWDEKALWLFGPAALAGEPDADRPRARAWAAPRGGYYVLRGPASWAMIRCHTYRDRPGQADMLHLDLWFRGHNVLRDGGSYLYASEPPWDRYFQGTAAHNTVALDGADQMHKGPRFLWFRWTRSDLVRFADADVGVFQGRHYGYAHMPGRPVCTRQVVRTGDVYVVVDHVRGGPAAHQAQLRWRLCPGDWRREGDTWLADLDGHEFRIGLALPPAADVRLVAGRQDGQVEGWESLYYARRSPVPTLVAGVKAPPPVTMVTLLGPGAEVDALRAAGLDAATLAGAADLAGAVAAVAAQGRQRG